MFELTFAIFINKFGTVEPFVISHDFQLSELLNVNIGGKSGVILLLLAFAETIEFFDIFFKY